MMIKTYTTLYDENKTIENFLLETFLWSKQFYKKQGFPKEWSYLNVQSRKELSIPLSCLNHGKIAMADSHDRDAVKIISENDMMVALHKRENLHSHPLSYGETDNVLSILYALERNDLLQVNSSHYDRCLLYRLDFETSGLMLAAKNDEIYHTIRKNYSTVMKRKVYHLKCRGKFADSKKNEIKTWIHYLEPAGKANHKIRASHHCTNSAEQKMAKLSFQVLNYHEATNSSDVMVFLETGLRHQIRSQFAFEGHPLVGDVLYGGSKSSRLFLHAFEYELKIHDKTMIFQAPLPDSWFKEISITGQ